jgi:Ca2+-binding EF-hand superfamily protein
MRIPPDSLSTQLVARRPLIPTPQTGDRSKPTITVQRPTPPTSTPTQGSAPISQEGFNKVWGTDNADYDLNGDGTVDVQDLIQFINGGGTQTPEEPSQDPAQPLTLSTGTTLPSTAAADEPEGEEPNAITIEGLFKAWGTDNADYDLNGDGRVNVEDLIQFLTGQQGEEAQGPQNDVVGRIDASRVDGLGRLSDHLIGRLEERGFNEPPSRLATMLEKLPISKAEQDQVLSNVLKAYPPGRSLDVTG